MAASQVHGIQEITKRLRTIADQCCETQRKEEQEKDEFLRNKVRMYEILEQVREDIRSRQALLKSKGNCMESIQKGQAIRKSLEELKELLTRLQRIVRQKNSSRRGGAGARKKSEETEARYSEIRQLKKQVDEAASLFQGSISDLVQFPELSEDGQPGATLFGNRALREAARAERDREKTAEEQAVLDEMKRRDQDIDQDLDALDGAVGRLGDLAREMGSTAARQADQINNINKDADKANTELEALNKKISEVIRYEKGTTCCCQMFLGLGLLCVVGFIFSQMS